jgi:hypothetical protein
VGGRLTETDEWRKARKLSEGDLAARHYPTLRKAVQAYRRMLTEDVGPDSAPP